MKKHFINVNAISCREIDALFYIDDIDLNSMSFYLKDKDGIIIPLEKEVYLDRNIAKIILRSSSDLSLGKDYRIYTSEEENCYLDYDEFISSKDFEDKYTYEGEDLGATYSKSETMFKLYSPLASKAQLRLENNPETFVILNMNREEHGIYSINIKGDLLNKRYQYILTINGKERPLRDLYGKGVSLNSEYSAVVDVEAIKNIQKIKPANEIRGLQDEIIYEVNIRDFTEEDGSRPTYEEFIKKIPYLNKLGITYVQLQPILDFDNIDDLLIDTYNWGYDPLSFFAIEGSYSKSPEEPMSRLYEFRHLVDELHKAGIRVTIDVVYNHVFDYEKSDWEKSFPGYYFRKFASRMCNASGCGNDFASERKMAGKMIIDSIKYLMETFDVDGFRFDLLGLIDIDTTKEIIRAAKEIKPDVLLYGEGWDMGTNLPTNKRSSINNAIELPGMAFFNADFRDTIRGNNFDLHSRGYASGNLDGKRSMENLLLGSYLNSNFINAKQTINYVECHDNHTLYDKISPFYDNEEDRLRHVKFATALTILSLGHPLIHMGQEIGLSKFGLDNTYNIMNVNNMNWKLVNNREEYVNYVRDLIHIRKKLELFSITDKDEILKTFELYQHEDSGIMTIKVINPKFLHGYKAITVVINPTDKETIFNLDDYYEVALGANGIPRNEIIVKSYMVPPCLLTVLVKK